MIVAPIHVRPVVSVNTQKNERPPKRDKAGRRYKRNKRR